MPVRVQKCEILFYWRVRNETIFINGTIPCKCIKFTARVPAGILYVLTYIYLLKQYF